MNGDQPFYENQVFSKKLNKIDDEPQTGKKGKKSKKNKQSIADVEDQVIGRDREKPGGKMSAQQSKFSVKETQSDEKIFSQLCARLPEYKQGTILKFLQETNFDKEETYARVLMTVPDNEKQSDWMMESQTEKKFDKKRVQIEESSTSSGPSENANVIMNEVFDSLLKEEINGREFEELFEEIAQMIKEDQKEKGVGIMEINSFVDQCNSVKQTLLVGFREQLSNFDDFEVDSTSQLYAQIQEFIQEIITKQVQQEKKMEQDFPTLGGGASKKKNIVEQIKSENKKKKEEEHFFTPSRNMLPTFAREKHSETSLFNVDNKLASQKDLISLHQEFQDVPIIDLKFIYKALAGDYNRTVEFLSKCYDAKQKHKLVRQIRVIHHSQPSESDKKSKPNAIREEEGVDRELEHLSLEDLRDEIDHLYKLRQAFQITKMKIKNSNQRKQLDRICCQNDPLLRKLSRAARIKTIQWMLKNNPLYVDLHGWRQDEVSELLDSAQRMVVEQANIGNEKIRTRVSGGRRTACLTVMTGKGLHSKGRKSVLKPVVMQWCQENKLIFEEAEDHVKVYIVIN